MSKAFGIIHLCIFVCMQERSGIRETELGTNVSLELQCIF